MTIFGGGESSRHDKGRAISSPSASVPVTSTTATSGRLAGAAMRRPRLRSIPPSAAMSFSIAFRAMRSPPLMPKARAISRLPTGVGLPRI